MSEPLGDRVLRPAVAAAKLGVHTRTLRRWVRAGLLAPPIRIGPRACGFKASVLDAWLTERSGEQSQT